MRATGGKGEGQLEKIVDVHEESHARIVVVALDSLQQKECSSRVRHGLVHLTAKNWLVRQQPIILIPLLFLVPVRKCAK